MASYEPLGIAGVIGCGAGFHDDAAPIRKAPGFAYFGTVGNRDFNYYEMRALDEKLAGAKADYRIEVFDGAHDWPPPPVARHAIAWMEVQAIRRGARPREDAAVAALYQEDLARARALESEGRAQDALARYERIAADFRGLSDTPEASAKAAALGQSAPIRKAQKEARRRDARDVAALNELSRKLSRAMKASEIPTAGFLGAELGIPALRKQAASAASPEDRLSAERLLANLRVQTSFYVPERMFAANDATHALLALGVAAEIDPEEPTVYYNLACGHARAGQTTRALEALDLAVARGFQRFELLDTDPDFARVREDPAFRAWAAAHKE
jgi:tetratricopeptide (TPR) repeat protein